jgi:DHA1 family multidrug resistance protein-like MFS transporter
MMLGVLGVLAPLKLGEFGLSGLAIGAIFLGAASLETATNLFFGRWTDRVGRERPLRVSLSASVCLCLMLPLGRSDWSLALLVLFAGIAFGAFFAPAMALLADQSDRAGLELALGFALINIAWAPGQLVGAAGGGALASAVSNSAPYLILAALCAVTLAALKPLLRLEQRLGPEPQPRMSS